jgi:hypothetical protein
MGETVNHKMLVMTALVAGVVGARPASAQGTVRCTSVQLRDHDDHPLLGRYTFHE